MHDPKWMDTEMGPGLFPFFSYWFYAISLWMEKIYSWQLRFKNEKLPSILKPNLDSWFGQIDFAGIKGLISLQSNW